MITKKLMSMQSLLIALSVATGVACGFEPAQAASVLVTTSPPLVGGSGSFDLGNALNLAPGERAVFSSGTATFLFNAADAYRYVSTTYTYLGSQTGSEQCYGFLCYSITTTFYNSVNNYSGSQESATALIGSQSVTGAPMQYPTLSFTGTQDIRTDINKYTHYSKFDNITHTGGSFTDVVNLSTENLDSLKSGNGFKFNIALSNPNIAFNSVTFEGVYDSVSGVPEPATWALMLLGFGLIGFAMRKRSNVRTTVSYA